MCFIDYAGLQMTKKHNIAELYERVKERHDKEEIKLRVNVQHPSLKPRLRNYQKSAVIWMLHREKVDEHEQGENKLVSLEVV